MRVVVMVRTNAAYDIDKIIRTFQIFPCQNIHNCHRENAKFCRGEYADFIDRNMGICGAAFIYIEEDEHASNNI